MFSGLRIVLESFTCVIDIIPRSCKNARSLARSRYRLSSYAVSEEKKAEMIFHTDILYAIDFNPSVSAFGPVAAIMQFIPIYQQLSE